MNRKSNNICITLFLILMLSLSCYAADKKPIFTSDKIPETMAKEMTGLSWQPNDNIQISDLRLITVTLWGFDDKPHTGEMIVHKTVTKELLDIFKELYKKKYPIEKMNRIDKYNADDNLSMVDNNSSAFCYRVMTGSNKISKHSYGVAIDINPLQNPYIKGRYIAPIEGMSYANRENKRKGMIYKDDDCYKAFTKRGWIWGGEWESVKDYQHFEKKEIPKK